jgi:hypothetical protein
MRAPKNTVKAVRRSLADRPKILSKFVDFFQAQADHGWNPDIVAFVRTHQVNPSRRTWSVHCLISEEFASFNWARVTFAPTLTSDRVDNSKRTWVEEMEFFERVARKMSPLGYASEKRSSWSIGFWGKSFHGQIFNPRFEKKLRSEKAYVKECGILGRLSFEDCVVKVKGRR